MFSTIPRRWIWLGLILLLGLGLRARGLQWGLPTQGLFHFGSSFRPDEGELFAALRELSLQRKQFHPTNLTFLLKGTLQVYVVGAALGVAYPWLTVSKDREVYKKNPDALGRIYLVGRVVSVLQSLGAVAALFWLGTLLVNWKVGAGAAALLAVAPVHVVNGHYISPDSAFCLYLLLLSVACVYIFKTASLRSYLAAGVCFGLLVANKYNAATAGLIILMAHFLSESPQKSVRSLTALVVVAGVVFIAGSPAVIFGWKDLQKGLAWSYNINVGHRPFMYDAGTPFSAARFYLWDAYFYGLGVPLLFACLVGLLYMTTHFSRAHWLWVPWLVLFYATLFLTGWRLIRWIMPLTPFFFLEAARLWNDTTLWGRWKGLRHVLAVIVLGYTTLYSFSYVQAMTTPDTRNTSSDWIVQHIPRGSRIAMYGTPYFWTPTIFQSPYYHPDEAEALRRDRGYEMFYMYDSLDDFRKARPTHAILTCYNYNVYLRDPKHYQSFPQGRVMGEFLDPQKYKVLAVFEKQLPLGGAKLFGNTFDYPHDWRYPFPKISILGKVT